MSNSKIFTATERRFGISYTVQLRASSIAYVSSKTNSDDASVNTAVWYRASKVKDAGSAYAEFSDVTATLAANADNLITLTEERPSGNVTIYVNSEAILAKSLKVQTDASGSRFFLDVPQGNAYEVLVSESVATIQAAIDGLTPSSAYWEKATNQTTGLTGDKLLDTDTGLQFRLAGNEINSAAATSFDINAADGAAGAVGVTINITSGDGGADTGATGGNGGAVLINSAIGGAETTGTAGNGGAITTTAADGGDSSGVGGNGGDGGAITVASGAGGDDTEGSAGTGGDGGNINITANQGGTGNTPGADGKIVFTQGGGIVSEIDGGAFGLSTITSYPPGGAITATSPIVTAGLGTAGTNVTATHYTSDGRNIVTDLVLSAVSYSIAGAAAEAVGALIYTFPAGKHFHEVTSHNVAFTGGGTVDADTPDVGLGSVIATGAVSVLGGTATFEDYVTGSAAADCSGTAMDVGPVGATAGIHTGISLNATGDTKTLHLNIADTWAGADTVTASGTITIKWTIV